MAIIEKKTLDGQGVGHTFWLDIQEYLDQTNQDELPTEVRECLEEQASERAFEMMKEGYSMGNLCCSYFDSDTETDHEFDGWWKAN